MAFSALLYYLFLIPLSLLPFSVLYLISDGLFILLYYAIGYRRKIIYENLKNSFPAKSETELKSIQKKFYRHFCDLIVESVKAFTIVESSLHKRIRAVNNNLLEEYFVKGKSVVLVTCHYGNWEWGAMTFPTQSPHKSVAIYLPLNNKFLNKKFEKSRSRFGTQLIPVKHVPRFFDSEKKLFTCSFLSDQSPSNPKAAYWLTFLSQETGVLQGPEYYARKYNLPVVFGVIKKVKRGFYEIEYTPVTDEPAKMKDGEITEKFTRLTEKYINLQPEYWLWSHRRWKQKRMQK